MSRRLILARHAQSTLDAEQRYSGTLDPGLSERGTREANALAFSLALNRQLSFDSVFVSTRLAAKRTAKVIMRRFVGRRRLEEVEALDERDYGELTGLTHAEALALFGEAEIARRVHGDFRRDEPLAERMRAFYSDRLIPLLKDAETILVISYDDNLRAISAIIDRNPIERRQWRTGMALDYTFDEALTVVSREKYQSWKWNEG